MSLLPAIRLFLLSLNKDLLVRVVAEILAEEMVAPREMCVMVMVICVGNICSNELLLFHLFSICISNNI